MDAGEPAHHLAMLLAIRRAYTPMKNSIVPLVKSMFRRQRSRMSRPIKTPMGFLSWLTTVNCPPSRVPPGKLILARHMGVTRASGPTV